MSIDNLKEIVSFNSSFKTAVNLYLSLNKSEKILNYIPTKSSLIFMDDYLNAVIKNKEQATLLVGPYGKGKSHLLLVLLGVLSLERNDRNSELIHTLANKISAVDEVGEKTACDLMDIWDNKKRFLPVILNASNQCFYRH